MKLVNCPVCGTRCSAATIKCPNCGFEIKQYFEAESIPKKNKKATILLVACVCIGMMLLLLISLFLNKPAIEEQSTVTATIESSISTSTLETSTEIIPDPGTPEQNMAVSGVYSGDDHEILVLNSDGLAYYYCAEQSFTELECPWYIKDEAVYIDLSRLHCTITAKIDEKELLFKSDSVNWNTELFSRLDVEPEQYLTRALTTYDPDATLNSDGTITYAMDGIQYTLPKSFIDYQDESDYQTNWSIFIDEDAQSDYVSGLLFYRALEEKPNQESITDIADAFASRFLEGASVSSATDISVAGYTGFICEVSGYYNQGFGGIQNYEASGFIAVFYNEDTHNNNYVLLTQNANRSTDNTALFNAILQSAKK